MCCTLKLVSLSFFSIEKSLITLSFLDSLHVDFRFHYFKMRQREGQEFIVVVYTAQNWIQKAASNLIPIFPTLSYLYIYKFFLSKNYSFV